MHTRKQLGLLGTVGLLLLLLCAAGRVQAANNGTLVGTSSYIASATGFGQALNSAGTGYLQIPAVVAAPMMSASGTWTYEIRFTTTINAGAGTSEFLGGLAGSGGGSNWWVAMEGSSGHIIVHNQGFAQFQGGPVVNDGAWHTLAVVVTGGTTENIYEDGTRVASFTGTYSPPTGTANLQAGAWAGNDWNGSIDEACVSSIAQYSGVSYTVAAAPLSNSRSGQTALYHLDTSVADSALSVSLSAAPAAATTGTPISVTLTGTNTAWTAGSPGSPTFTVSGGTGASITAQSVASATSATLTVSPGSAAGTLTITDPLSAATTTITVAAPSNVTVADANLFFSPYNWYINGTTFAETNNPGAYLKSGFTGTSLSLAVDVSPETGAAVVAGDYPVIAWSIDGGAVQTLQLTSTSANVSLVAGLAGGTHALMLWDSAEGGSDRWNTPAVALRITGLLLDGGSATAAIPAGSPFVVRAGRAIAYADSITEGRLDSSGPGVNANAVQSYIQAVAQQRGQEIGIIAFAGQGYTAAHSANGNVPALFTPGTDAASSWNKYFSGQSRLTTGLLSPAPADVYINMGTNDQGAAAGTLTSAVTGLLGAITTAAPAARKWVLIAPAGYQRATITSAAQSAGAAVVDIGNVPGLTGSPSYLAPNDGTHPGIYGQSLLGTLYGAAIAAKSSGTKRRLQ